jgi:hypothetical protein
MNLRQFSRGARVLLSNGAMAEVVAPTEDGVRMRIRYVDSPFSPEQVGNEDWCTEDQVVAEGAGESNSKWGSRNGSAHNFSPRSRDR